MKKIVFGIFISILMIGSIITGSASVYHSEKNENLTLYKYDEIVASIPVGSYEIVSTNKGDIVTVEDYGRLLTPGKPDLPTKIFAIAIPPGAEYRDISYETGEEIELPEVYSVMPIPLPQVIGIEDIEVRKKEEQVYNENYEITYNSDELYPSSIIEYERSAGFRKYNIVDVRVNPFSYKPLSGKLTYYPEITVHISYTFPESNNLAETMVDKVVSFEQRANEFILNYEEAKDWYKTDPSGRSTYDYVLITLDSLTSSVNSLVNWEELKGRSVNVVTTSWINTNYNGYDLGEKIRNFLIEKYPSDEWGIEFVCLVGDYDDVPIRLTAQNQGYGRPRTDFYYAELSYPDSESWDADGDHQYGETYHDPVDFYAEVYLGRIPWSDPATIEHICEKTVLYEQINDESFKKNILLLGAFFWWDTDNAVLMEYKTNPSYHPWMSDWTMTKMYEQGQSSYPMDYNLDYTNVENVWSSEPFAFVNWAGHGSPTACYEYYPSKAFVDTDTCNSLNDDFPAIIFADACSNSDTNDDNIGKMMLKQGAVGFLGATKVAYGMHAWDNPMSGSSQSLDYWFTTGCTEGILTQGESHQRALQNMYENDLWYYPNLEHFEWGALWGNPDLTMGEVETNKPPANPQKPSGPAIGHRGTEYTFTTITTDPEGDDVYYLWDWGDGNFSEWLDTNEASYTWSEIGDYEIRVMAKDINGGESEWSETHTMSIIKNKAVSNPIFLKILEKIIMNVPIFEKILLFAYRG